MTNKKKDEKKDNEANEVPIEKQEISSESDIDATLAEAAKQGSAPDSDEEPVDAAEDLKNQIEAMSDRYIRLMAEFDNFKKRVSRDYERLVEAANEKLMQEMIEVRENFDRAIRTVEEGQEQSNFFNGVKLIYSKFDEVLKKNGLEVFAEPGEVFDPQVHDALMKVPSETIAEDHVAEVFEKGYRLKNKVVRHAKVLVSSGKPAEAQA